MSFFSLPISPIHFLSLSLPVPHSLLYMSLSLSSSHTDTLPFPIGQKEPAEGGDDPGEQEHSLHHHRHHRPWPGGLKGVHERECKGEGREQSADDPTDLQRGGLLWGEYTDGSVWDRVVRLWEKLKCDGSLYMSHGA